MRSPKIKTPWGYKSYGHLQLRSSLVAITLVGVISVLGKSILTSPKASHIFTPFAFPQTVPLPGWQFLESGALANQVNYPAKPTYIRPAEKYYRYTKNGLSLDIEMRYVVGNPGDVETYIRNHTSIPLPPAGSENSPILHQQTGMGFHWRFTHQDRAYLSACINPHGGSTATVQQFRQSRIASGALFSHLLPVSLGQESFWDERCLWAQLSVPLKNSLPEYAYQTLEAAWVPWYQWWRPNFPKP